MTEPQMDSVISTSDKTCNACHEAGLTCIKHKFSGEPCERSSQLDHSCIWSQETFERAYSAQSPYNFPPGAQQWPERLFTVPPFMGEPPSPRFMGEPPLPRFMGEPPLRFFIWEPVSFMGEPLDLLRAWQSDAYLEHHGEYESSENGMLIPRTVENPCTLFKKRHIERRIAGQGLCACVAANGWRRAPCRSTAIHCKQAISGSAQAKSVKKSGRSPQHLRDVETKSSRFSYGLPIKRPLSCLDQNSPSVSESMSVPLNSDGAGGSRDPCLTNKPHLHDAGLHSSQRDSSSAVYHSPTGHEFHNPNLTYTPITSAGFGSGVPSTPYQYVPTKLSNVTKPLFSDSLFDLSSVPSVPYVSQSLNTNPTLFLDPLGPNVATTPAHTLSVSNENQGTVEPGQLGSTSKDFPGDPLMGGTYQAIDNPEPYHLNEPLDVFNRQDQGRTTIRAQSSTDWTVGASHQLVYTTPSITITNSQTSTPTSDLTSMLGSPARESEVDPHSGSQEEGHSILIPGTTPDVETHESNLGPSSLQWKPDSPRLYPSGRFQNVSCGIWSSPSSMEEPSGSVIGCGLDSPPHPPHSAPTLLFSPHLTDFDTSQVPPNHQDTFHDFMSNPYFAHSSQALSQLQNFSRDLSSISRPASLQGNSATSALRLTATNEIGGGTVNPSQLHGPPQGIPMHDHEPGIAEQGLHHPDHALADVSELTNGDDEASASAERVSLTSSDVFPNFGPLITSSSATVSPPTISAVLNTSPVHHLGEIHNVSWVSVHSDSVNQTKTTMAEEMPESESDHGPSQRKRTSKTSTFHPYKRHSDVRKSMVGTPRSSVENSTIDHNFLDNAFSATSRCPDPILRRLLLAVLESQFYLCDQLEPIFGSQKAERLLAPIDTDSCKFVIGRDRAGKSILLVFIDTASVSCLMCGKAKGSLERALGCVRAHLGYRPFWCSGASVGCKSCTTIEFKRFYSQSLLNDHLSRQASKPTCDACGKSFCRGNIARHWRAKHSEIPFPSNLYPRYKLGSNQPSEADKPTPISDSGYSSA